MTYDTFGADPWTVVVHLEYATTALATMMGSFGFRSPALHDKEGKSHVSPTRRQQANLLAPSPLPIAHPGLVRSRGFH